MAKKATLIKIRRMCKKDYIWTGAACSGENGKYLASIIRDEYIKEIKTTPTKTVPTHFNKKR